MRQHRPHYFHVKPRRPSSAINGATRHAGECASRNLGPVGKRSAKVGGKKPYRDKTTGRARRARCAPAVRGRRHGLAVAVLERGTRRSRPRPAGIGAHHAAMLAMMASDRLAQTRRQRLRGLSASRQLETLPVHSTVSLSAARCMTADRNRGRCGREGAGIRDLRPFRIPAPPGVPIARHPGSRETDGTANNAPPGHSAGTAECMLRVRESVMARHRSRVRPASNRPGQPLGYRLPAGIGPLASPDH